MLYQVMKLSVLVYACYGYRFCCGFYHCGTVPNNMIIFLFSFYVYFLFHISINLNEAFTIKLSKQNVNDTCFLISTNDEFLGNQIHQIYSQSTVENTDGAIKKWTVQRNWQHRVHKTKKNKTKAQHNMCWTPLCTKKKTTTEI